MLAKLSMVAVALVGLTACRGVMRASDVYIAQNASGANNGQDCADAHAYTFFNDSGNWGSGGAIGPGTTVHLCGTFTGAAGGMMLQFQGSGTSGQVLTLRGEPGTYFSAPYWGYSHGAIDVNGQSFITIDGGSRCGWSNASHTVTPCNMTIVNTNNGTTLAYHAASVGISVPSGSNNVEIKNVDIHNIYQRSGLGNEDDANYTNQNCISLGWTGAGVTNVTVDHSICHDVGWGYSAGGPGPLTFGPGNEMYNADHNIDNAAVTEYIFGNHFHDWAIWTNSAGSAHHDGFHCFAGSGGASDAIYIYDNQFDGNPGDTGLTGFVFLEGAGSSTSCFVPGAQGAYVFNNVAVLQNNIGAEFWLLGNSGGSMKNAFMANNTVIGNQPASTTSAGAFVIQQTDGAVFTNNAVGGISILIGQHPGVSWATAPDYNFYEDCISGGPCFAALGQSTNSFASWQSAGFDLHGSANLTSTTFDGLNTSCAPSSTGANCAPASGSPLIGSGKNLSGMCSGQSNPGLGALCYDFSGVARPSSGAWDVGAYQASAAGTAAPISPPTSLSASIH